MQQANKATVSAVMVVCNVDRFLAEAIESTLNQTFCDLEFIIVDFGSTDKSLEIISSYAARDSRIKLHEIAHCNVAEARNVACFLAQGRYLAIQDADDISLPQRLMWEVDFMEKHPEVGVLGGAVQWIDARGTPLFVMDDYPTCDRELRVALDSFCPIWQPTVLMRRDAFTRVGGYRVAFDQTEDYDLWVRISEHLQIANLKQVVLNYRIHPNQVSLRKRKQQTLCFLAAQASAAARRNGIPDPLNVAEEITPALLVGLGVTEAMQQGTLARDYNGWIRIMDMAGEWSGALAAANEMLKASDWKYLKRRTLADMYAKIARLYWKNGRFLMSIITAGRAVMMRPMLAGRFLELLLQRLRLV